MRSPTKRRLDSLAEAVLRFLGREDASVAVWMVGDRVMRSLNRRFRGKHSSTNVLAFPTPSEFPRVPEEPWNLGEVYLNPTYISEHGENIEYLLVHGILHLVGFDHEEKDGRIKMERLEQKILSWVKTTL